MTSGREAARDLRYGRRGGRWGNEWTGRVAELLASFDRDRARARELDRRCPCDGTRLVPPFTPAALAEELVDGGGWSRALDAVREGT